MSLVAGDGTVPFRVSVLTVLVNGCLNWLFTGYLSFGPQGATNLFPYIVPIRASFVNQLLC